MPTAGTFLMTIDVEDWFQVENFKRVIPYASWPQLELRVERNIHLILELLDTAAAGTGANRLPATFFVLGWIAERLPHLVRLIHRRGHEIASHGYRHNLCSQETTAQLKSDLELSKKLLEDLIGDRIHGYRAPSFSVSNAVLQLIRSTGYRYDSSYNSCEWNPRYGRLGPLPAHNGRPFRLGEDFFELPVSNFKIGRRVLPWGGGGYFRLLPLVIFKAGVRRLLSRNGAYLFYLHPWELDPEQPRVAAAGATAKLRHYLNLKKTRKRFQGLLRVFRGCEFMTCREYIDRNFPKPKTRRQAA